MFSCFVFMTFCSTFVCVRIIIAMKPPKVEEANLADDGDLVCGDNVPFYKLVLEIVYGEIGLPGQQKNANVSIAGITE